MKKIYFTLFTVFVLCYNSVSFAQTFEFFDDFEAYSAGQQLACQNPVDWTTWSNLPCDATEDAYISSNYAYSGVNSVVVVQNNDLVKSFGSKTSGTWYMSFNVYIPTGKSGYFNTLTGYTPNPFEWGMECYFDAGGGGRLLNGATVTFSWTENTWQFVEVIVDLDLDQAQFWFNGSQVASWQWTRGTLNQRLDANDFFGAAATDEMYFDDYRFGDTPVSVEEENSNLPTEFSLSQNYPNPFNPSTKINYSIAQSGFVKLSVYNIVGEEVAVLVNGQVEAGFYEVNFDAGNLPSGAYFYKLRSGNTVEVKKMLLTK